MRPVTVRTAPEEDYGNLGEQMSNLAKRSGSANVDGNATGFIVAEKRRNWHDGKHGQTFADQEGMEGAGLLRYRGAVHRPKVQAFNQGTP